MKFKIGDIIKVVKDCNCHLCLNEYSNELFIFKGHAGVDADWNKDWCTVEFLFDPPYTLTVHEWQLQKVYFTLKDFMMREVPH